MIGGLEIPAEILAVFWFGGMTQQLWFGLALLR